MNDDARVEATPSGPTSVATKRPELSGHVCKRDDLCCCYSLALEPHPKCPVHGESGPDRCSCGRFV